MTIYLRNERADETRTVEELTREAFWNVYIPGCTEHYLLHEMRRSASFLPELSLVAEQSGRLVGHIACARTSIALQNGGMLSVLTFGPISVLPAYQGKGIGGQMIEAVKSAAREMGFPGILITGDPAYYSRFGFVPAEQFGIRNADGRFADALLAFELLPSGLTAAAGRFLEGDAYTFDESRIEEFDRTFPVKKKGYAPSQDRFLTLVQQVHD